MTNLKINQNIAYTINIITVVVKKQLKKLLKIQIVFVFYFKNLYHWLVEVHVLKLLPPHVWTTERRSRKLKIQQRRWGRGVRAHMAIRDAQGILRCRNQKVKFYHYFLDNK